MKLTLSKSRVSSFRRAERNKKGELTGKVLEFMPGVITEVAEKDLSLVANDIGGAIVCCDDHCKPDHEATEEFNLEIAEHKIEAAAKIGVAPDLTPSQKAASQAPIETDDELSEEEKQRLADEEKQRLADEAEKKRLADEAEKKRLADEERQRLADEELGDDWREKPLNEIEAIESKVLEHLNDAGLTSIGQVLDYGRDNDGLTPIKGVGEATEKSILDAIEPFVPAEGDAEVDS